MTSGAVLVPFFGGVLLLKKINYYNQTCGVWFKSLYFGGIVINTPRPGVTHSASNRFDPLHCGALIFTDLSMLGASSLRLFRSPSLRGIDIHSPNELLRQSPEGPVSIPFITGH